GIEHTTVLDRVADAHVHDDLVGPGHLHHVAVPELIAELGHQLGAEALLQPRRVVGHQEISVSHLRQIRTFLSPSMRWPIRVGWPQLGQTSWTFEMSMNSSVSMIPPCCSC